MTNDWHAAVLRFVCKGEERFPRHLVVNLHKVGTLLLESGDHGACVGGISNVHGTDSSLVRKSSASMLNAGSINQVPREAFFALADEAKHRSMPIIGHVPWSVTVAEASNAGQRSMEHLDGPVLECAFASTPNLREQMVAGKVPPTLEILQSALDHCDPGKMTDLFKLLAKNETWQVPTLVQLLFTEKPGAARDLRLKYVIPPIREEWAAMLTGMDKNLDLLHRIFLLKLGFV